MPIREHPMTARGLPLKFLLKLLLALLLAPAPAWPAPLQNVPDNAVAANRVDIRDHGGHADAWRGAMHYGAIGTHVTIGSVQILNVTLSSAGGASATISPAFVAPTLEGQTPGEVSNASMTLTAPGAGPGGAVVHGDITASSASTGVITCGGCTFAAQSGTAVKLELYVRDQNGTASNAGASYGITTTAPLLDERGNAVGTVLRLPQPMFGHGNTTQAMTGLRFCIRAQGEQEWCGTATQDPADDGMTVHLVGLPGSPAALPAQGPNRLMVYWAPVLFRPDDATACAGQPRSIELPLTGAGRNPTTGQLNPTEGRIAARADPFNVTLAAQIHTRVPANGIGGIDGEVTIGCDDWPAYQAAVRALYRRADPDQQAELYFPADSFMASAGGGGINIMYPTVVIQCGEGTVFWSGLNQTFYHGAAACQGTRPIASFPDVKDVVPAVTLRHLATLPAGATAVLVTAGNSPMGPGTNSAGFISSRHTKLCEAFQRAYPDLVWKCIDRAFGGTQFWSLDPGGITNGIPVGSAAPAWYTDLSKSWLGYYIRNDAPDVLVIGFANQEGFDLHLSALLESIAYTQTPAWAAATGKNPDIGLMPWPWQPTHYLSQVGTNFAASFQRSFVKACNSSNTLLASKGCPFLIDVARMESIAADGTDPEELPMRRTYALPSAGGAITAFPWFYTTPRPGLLGTVELAHAAPKPSAGIPSAGSLFAAAGGEIDMTISANAVATPQHVAFGLATPEAASSAAGQTTLTIGPDAYKLSVGYGVRAAAAIPPGSIVTAVDAAAGTITLSKSLTAPLPGGRTIIYTPPGPSLGYPGGILRISKDATSGHIATRYDTVYATTPGADCSGTKGDAYITCRTPQIGNWHRGLSIAIPGGGTAPCPNPGGAADCAIGRIASVSFAPDLVETVRFASGRLSATVANVAPIIYRTSLKLEVSGRDAEVLTGGCGLAPGSGIRLSLQFGYRGSRAQLSYCDTGAYPGPSKILDRFVERFDSPFPFALDSPNHMGDGAVILPAQANFPVFSSIAGAKGSVGSFFEAAPEYPTSVARLRVSPDIYGWCRGAPFGNPLSTPYGGECASHQGQMGAHEIDDAILSMLRLR